MHESELLVKHSLWIIILHNIAWHWAIEGCMKIYWTSHEFIQRAGRRVGYHSWQVWEYTGKYTYTYTYNAYTCNIHSKCSIFSSHPTLSLIGPIQYEADSAHNSHLSHVHYVSLQASMVSCRSRQDSYHLVLAFNNTTQYFLAKI